MKLTSLYLKNFKCFQNVDLKEIPQGLLIIQGIFFYISIGLIYPPAVSDPGLIFPIVGASMLGWVFGFILPGAPGGFGVRESIVVFTLSLYADDGALLLAAFLLRIILVLADVTAFLFANIIKKIAKIDWVKKN